MSDLWWLIAAVAVMTVLSIYDIRSRRIPVAGFAILFIMSVLYRMATDGSNVYIPDLVWGIVPGLLMMGLSLVTEQKVGTGDGILILILGLGMGPVRCVYVLAGAMVLCCVFCGVLLLIHRAGRNTQIPFVPFITLGMGVMAIACG